MENLETLLNFDGFYDEFVRLDFSMNVLDSNGETFHSNWEGNKYFENENHSFGEK